MSPTTSANILIADDDPTSLCLLSATLGALQPDPHVVAVTNGREAIQSIDSAPPDLVITDVRMPGADGFQVLAHVVSKRLAVPVIAVTGYSTPELKAALLESGACLLLEKPVTEHDLVAAVEKLPRADNRGHLEGFTLSSILQLIEMEGKSSEVSVTSDGRTGILAFLGGRLVHARTQDNLGDAAAFEILSWAAPQVDIRENLRPRCTTVTGTLTYLLLERARLEDDCNRPLREGLEALTEGVRENDSETEMHAHLLDEVATLPGFVAASIVQLNTQRRVLSRSKGPSGSGDSSILESVAADCTTRAVCNLVEAEREVARASGEISTTDVILLHKKCWHLVRGLTGTLILHLILDDQGNAALAEYRLTRWLASCLDSGPQDSGWIDRARL